MDELNAALSEVKQAIRGQDLRRAAELASTALASGLEHPLLLNLRAMTAEGEGRILDALADLERASGLDPNDYTLQNALGLCLGRLERMTQALAAFERAIVLEPKFAPGHFNRGWVLENLGELVDARHSFEQAVALNPDYAEALGKLALLAARRGDHGAALLQADRALALAPGQTWARLAKAAAGLETGRAGQVGDQVQPVLADQSASTG